MINPIKTSVRSGATAYILLLLNLVFKEVAEVVCHCSLEILKGESLKERELLKASFSLLITLTAGTRGVGELFWYLWIPFDLKSNSPVICSWVFLPRYTTTLMPARL